MGVVLISRAWLVGVAFVPEPVLIKLEPMLTG